MLADLIEMIFVVEITYCTCLYGVGNTEYEVHSVLWIHGCATLSELDQAPLRYRSH